MPRHLFGTYGFDTLGALHWLNTFVHGIGGVPMSCTPGYVPCFQALAMIFGTPRSDSVLSLVGAWLCVLRGTWWWSVLPLSTALCHREGTAKLWYAEVNVQESVLRKTVCASSTTR